MQTGFITAKELGPLLRSLGDTPRTTELQELIALVDADGNAVIDFQEFLVLVAIRSCVVAVQRWWLRRVRSLQCRPRCRRVPRPASPGGAAPRPAHITIACVATSFP